MKRIKVTGWIDVDQLPPEKVDLTSLTGLTEEAYASFLGGFDADFPFSGLDDLHFKLEDDDAMRTMPAHEVEKDDVLYHEDGTTYDVLDTKPIYKGESLHRVHLLLSTVGGGLTGHAVWHSFDPNEPVDIFRPSVSPI